MSRITSMNCPNRSNHVSSWPSFGLALCSSCGECYVDAKDMRIAVPKYTPRYEPEPIPVSNLQSVNDEVIRYVVTMNPEKEYTVRLASDQGKGYLARDKDLAACLRTAAIKLDSEGKRHV